MNFLNKKVTLVTGGCGSFGQKFTEIFLKEHNPKSIRIYDNRELVEVETKKKSYRRHGLHYCLSRLKNNSAIF